MVAVRPSTSAQRAAMISAAVLGSGFCSAGCSVLVSCSSASLFFSCPVQIAAQRGGFFLGLGQLGAELVGLVGFGVGLGSLGEKCPDGAGCVRLGPDGHDHGERLVVDVGQGGGDRGRGAELGGGVKRVNELCVIDRGEIGVGVVVAGGGGLLRLDRERYRRTA